MPKLIKRYVDRVLSRREKKYPETAIIYDIQGDRVDLRINSSILRYIMVQGNINDFAIGQEVNITWKQIEGSSSLRPVVMSGTTTNAVLFPDNETIEMSVNGLRVKLHSITREHLSFDIEEGGNPDPGMLPPAEGPGIDVATTNSGAAGIYIGLGGDTILLYSADGDPVAEFAATDAGLDLASAAASANNKIIIPSNTVLTSDHTLANCDYEFPSTTYAITLTLVNGTVVYRAHLEPADGSGLVIVGFIGPSSGEAKLFDVISIPTNTSTGGVRAVYGSNGGRLKIYGNSFLDGRNNDGVGDTYAAYAASGSFIYIYGGTCLPSSDPFNI